MPYKDPNKNREYQRLWQRQKENNETDRRFKHDWAHVQELINSGLSRKEIIEQLKIGHSAWTSAVKKKRIIPPPPKPASKMQRRHRKKLLDDANVPECCSECGLPPSWNDKPLVLQIDHINGLKEDDRLENLRYLCPNCHSQTDTFGSKNKKWKRREDK